MRPRVVLVAVALWLGVIGVGSGITWVFIEQVGQDVTPQASPGLVGDQVPMPSPQTSSPEPPRRTPTPRAGPKRAKASAPASAPSAEPVDPTPATPPDRVRTPWTPAPEPDPARKEPARSDRTVTRTWVGAAGRVTASCTGAKVALGSASPSNGWRVEVGNRGPEEVEVKFEQQRSEGAEIHVGARCGAGEPRFQVGGDD